MSPMSPMQEAKAGRGTRGVYRSRPSKNTRARARTPRRRECPLVGQFVGTTGDVVNSSMISVLFGGRTFRFTGARAGNVETNVAGDSLRCSARGA
jgi:hypothetical protein